MLHSCVFFFFESAVNSSPASLSLCKLPYVALNAHLREMLTVRPLLKLTHAALWYFALCDSLVQPPLELLLKNITFFKTYCKELSYKSIYTLKKSTERNRIPSAE